MYSIMGSCMHTHAHGVHGALDACHGRFVSIVTLTSIIIHFSNDTLQKDYKFNQIVACQCHCVHFTFLHYIVTE